MAARNGFWNSVKQAGGVGDRLYNAEDLSFFYDMFFSNGIACSNNEMDDMFKVTISPGSYSVKIKNGACIIGGKWYNGKGEPEISLAMNTSHVVSSGKMRIDAVCIKRDDANRTFKFYIKEGEEAVGPTAPAIDKETELCFACYIVHPSYTVDYNSIEDTRHNANYAGCAQIKLDKPAYDVEINDYIETTYYIANGVNDNIVLSNLVQDYLKKEKTKDLEINIIGDIAISGYFAGEGTPADPKVLFALGGYGDTANNKNKVHINFVNSSLIKYVESTQHANNIIVFAGSNLKIRNVKLAVEAKTTAAVYAYRHYNGEIKDSYIKISDVGGQAYAAFGSGYFENNDFVVISDTSFARAIVPSGKIISAVHGRIPCYVLKNRILAQTKSGSAVGIYTNSADTNMLVIAKDNEIYSSTESGYKTNSAYQIVSGSAIIQNNILEIAGSVYTPADATQTIINDNNIVVDSLASKKISTYYE